MAFVLWILICNLVSVAKSPQASSSGCIPPTAVYPYVTPSAYMTTTIQLNTNASSIFLYKMLQLGNTDSKQREPERAASFDPYISLDFV